MAFPMGSFLRVLRYESIAPAAEKERDDRDYTESTSDAQDTDKNWFFLSSLCSLCSPCPRWFGSQDHTHQ